MIFHCFFIDITGLFNSVKPFFSPIFAKSFLRFGSLHWFLDSFTDPASRRNPPENPGGFSTGPKGRLSHAQAMTPRYLGESMHLQKSFHVAGGYTPNKYPKYPKYVHNTLW